MTARVQVRIAADESLAVGDVVAVASRAVVCSSCCMPTSLPVFMGVTADGARLPVWWCPSCKATFGPTS